MGRLIRGCVDWRAFSPHCRKTGRRPGDRSTANKERVMKVLLPVDGSEGALAAVRHALRLLHSGMRASFVIAHLQEPASLYEVVVAHDAQVIENVSTAAAAHSLEAAQALLR